MSIRTLLITAITASAATAVNVPGSTGGSAISRSVSLLQLPQNREYIPWFGSYARALAQARKTGKPIFLEFRCAP